MRKLRFTIYIILIFITVSLTCVGFASWNILRDTSIKDNGSIFADDNIQTSKYIKVSDITYFTYYNTGFLKGVKSSDSTKSNSSYELVLDNSYTSGSISINAKLNAALLKEDKNISKARIYVNIDYATSMSYDLFETSNVEVTYTASINNLNTEIYKTTNNDFYFDYNLDSDIDFNITMSIKTLQSYFISNLYEHFNTDKPSFHYSIYVLGVDE